MYDSSNRTLTMVGSQINLTGIWLFCSQASQAASQGGQETGTHPLKPLWTNFLVVKLDVSIGIAKKCSQTSSPSNSTTKCSGTNT